MRNHVPWQLLVRVTFAWAVVASSSSAWAGKAAPGSAVEAEVGIVSDYRFRGVSVTNGRPALQAGVTASLPDDWTAGVWTSLSLGERRYADEVDLYVGRSGSLGQVDYQVLVYAYLTPGAPENVYVELQSTFRRETAKAAFELQLAVVPEQKRIPANFYASLGANVPLHGESLGLLLRGGFEQGFADNKLDWEVGLAGERGGFRWQLSAVGSTARYDAPGDTAAVVLTLSHSL